LAVTDALFFSRPGDIQHGRLGGSAIDFPFALRGRIGNQAALIDRHPLIVFALEGIFVPRLEFLRSWL
jgi:hypothetical protein